MQWYRLGLRKLPDRRRAVGPTAGHPGPPGLPWEARHWGYCTGLPETGRGAGDGGAPEITTDGTISGVGCSP